jgi:putative nucleotidyltransferase with HDIG domain
MRKLLFVPADPRTSQALEQALRAKQEGWEWCIASSAGMAQDRLAEGELDAVVSDLGWETGHAILIKARESFPEVARIGVVSPSQLKIPNFSYVQQVTSNLLDLGELHVAVERSCRLRDVLRGERICQTVGELGELPSAPAVYLELMEKLNQADASIGEIAEIIEGDTAISAKLLQMVNSSMFRTSREIVTVKMAAGFLGLEVMKNLILSLGAFQAFEALPAISEFSLSGLQSHGRLTAAIAGQLGLPKDVRDAAIVAALLHDIGKLVLVYKMPDRFARLLARARSEKRPLYRIEEELWGITHAEVGAYLLGLWGLPIRVTEAIAYHHAPSSVPHHCFDAVAGVHVANLLAHENEGSAEQCEWDFALLETLGVADQLPDWKEMAVQTSLVQREGLQRGSESKTRQRVPVS